MDDKELALNIPQGQDVIAEVSQEAVPEQEIAAIPEKQPSEPEITTEKQPLPSGSVPEKLSNKHFKAIADKAERAERERDELMRMLQEERSRNGKSPIVEVEEDLGFGSDDFIEGKHLKKFASEVKELKKELAQYKQKTAIDVTETKLRAEFPDFNKVFSNENIEQLKEEHPEIAMTLGSSNADPYLVAKSTYKMIKKLGIHIEDTFENDKTTVQKNLSKPRPLASASAQSGDSPLSKANAFGGELTDELKAQLWKEVQDSTR